MAIYRWGRRLTPKGLAMLGIERGRAPCHSTYHYVFRAIAAADLERALGTLVAGDGPLGHVAIDGKRLRGQPAPDEPGSAHAAGVLGPATGGGRIAQRGA